MLTYLVNLNPLLQKSQVKHGNY